MRLSGHSTAFIMSHIGLNKITVLAKQFAVLPALLFLSPTLLAQNPDTAMIARAMAKYQNENSVITNYTQRLEISFEDGEISATTKIKRERLVIANDNVSSAQNRYDFVRDYYFDRLTSINAVAFVPQKNGTFLQNKKYSLFSIGAGDGNISDAAEVVTSFTGLTKGSFVRLTATQDHPELTALPTFIPVENYPIMHAEYEVVVPSYFNMKFVLKGENTSLIKQTKEEKNGNTIYRFTADNVPAYKQFSNVPSALYHVPHVITSISSFRWPGTNKDSLFLTDPAQLYKAQYKYVGNLNVKQDTGLKRLVAEITKGDATQRQKAEHIYDWVQKNMHYIGIEVGLGGWVPREADTVCKRKYGDCKDMSSLLCTMGRMAGLETYLAWIGTTLKPYTFEETPVPNVSNHMICAVKLGNEWLFMDGTHSYLPFGCNRDDIQGKEAMIAIDKDNFKILTIPTMAPEKNLTVDSSFIHISEKNDNNLEGRLKEKFMGYKAWNLAFHLSYVTKDKEEGDKEIAKLTSRGTDKYILDKYKLNISDTGNRNISVTGDFNIGGYVHKIGKEYIVNMNLHHEFEEDYIDLTEHRKVSWYHPYKYEQKDVVVMDIPSGYKVSSLPKNASGKLNDFWNYSIVYKTDGKKITLTKNYTLNALAISAPHFAENNKEILELEKQYKESVVLTAK